MLLNFAERVARQLVHQNERAGHFEGRQLLAANGFEISRIDIARYYHVGHGYFATHAIGRGCYRCLSDTVLLLEEFFDLPGIDVKTAGNNKIALAAAQSIVAVVGARSDVARAEIIAGKSRTRSFVATPVARENVGAFEMHFADLPVCH